MGWIRYLIFITVLLGFTLTHLEAQDFPKLHFTVEDGLPSNTVYSVYRDTRGYLWFATDKGIARYNGVRFERYTTVNGLADNEVFFFKEDYEGRLWMATYNGELCYYKEGKFFSGENTPSLKSSLKKSKIEQIFLESDSSVTIMWGTQLVNVTKSGSQWIQWDSRLTFFDQKQTLAVKKISRNEYKVICPQYTYKVDANDTRPIVFDSSHVIDLAHESGYWQYMHTQDQEYIISPRRIFDMNLNVLRTFPIGAESRYIVYGIYKWSDNWMYCTNHGAVVNDCISLISEKKVTSATQDIAGNFWLSTLNDGVFVFARDVFNMKLATNAYSSGVKYARVIDKNKVLLFADDSSNVSMWSANKTNLLFRYKSHFPPERIHSYSSVAIDDSLRYYYNSNCRSFVVDNLLSIHPKIKLAANDWSPSTPPKSSIISDGNVFVNAVGRVIKVSWLNGPKSGVKTTVITDTLHLPRMYSMAQAQDKTIWVSTGSGVYKLANDSLRLQPQLKQVVFREFEFCGNSIVGITTGSKLLVCRNLSVSVSIDTVKDESCVWDKIYVMDSGHVLVSTNDFYRVLSVENKYEPQISLHVIDDPFLPMRADLITVGSDRAFFFKNGSIVSVNKQRLYTKPDAPILRYTGIKFDGQKQNIYGEISIPYSSSKNISIFFSALSFHSKNIFYQYSVSKGADNWIDLKEEQINIVNSKYGDYSVKVRARTLSSDYSVPVTFKLTILRPFWATWWFIAVVTLCIACVILLLVRRRISAELVMREKEHNNQVKFMKSEYKALNALMNPHFIFNTLNNVQSLVNRDDKRAANEYLRIFADLIRQNMHNVSNELIPMEKEMQLVSNYLLLEKLRFKDKLHYAIDIDEGIDLSEIMVPPLLIQPLVENSIKHGIYPLESPDGTVIVEVFEDDKTLSVEVRDNGVGLSAPAKSGGGSEEHISFGLANIRKRVEQLSIIQNKLITFEISEEMRDGQNWTISRITMDL